LEHPSKNTSLSAKRLPSDMYIGNEGVVDKMRLELDRSQKVIHDYQNALDQSSIVAITDVKGNITYVNDKFCEISKYSRDELIGKNHRVINSGYHPKSFFIDLWRTIASGNVWRNEVQNKAKDGSLYWVDTTIVPFLGNDGRVEQYVSIRSDITDRKLAQKLLEEERVRLAYAEKMASLGEMAAGIAHELGNPLASVSSWFDVVISQAEKGSNNVDQMVSMMPVAREKISRMKNIIRGMLTYARDGSNDPYERISLNRVVNLVLEYCSYKLKKSGVNCEVFSNAKHDEVECRETEISQVLVNLISNSCDAVKDLPEKWIRIEMRDTGEGVELSIIDSGKGIDKDISHLVMNPFFTTKPSGSGTGLGLSISTSIISRHGGSLKIRSDCPNTCFVVYLPREHGGENTSS